MMLQQQAQVRARKPVKIPPEHPSLPVKRKQSSQQKGSSEATKAPTNTNKDTFQMEKLGLMKSFPIKSWVVVHAVLFSTAALHAGNRVLKGNHLQP